MKSLTTLICFTSFFQAINMLEADLAAAIKKLAFKEESNDKQKMDSIAPSSHHITSTADIIYVLCINQLTRSPPIFLKPYYFRFSEAVQQLMLMKKQKKSSSKGGRAKMDIQKLFCGINEQYFNQWLVNFWMLLVNLHQENCSRRCITVRKYHNEKSKRNLFNIQHGQAGHSYSCCCYNYYHCCVSLVPFSTTLLLLQQYSLISPRDHETVSWWGWAKINIHEKI